MDRASELRVWALFMCRRIRSGLVGKRPGDKGVYMRIGATWLPGLLEQGALFACFVQMSI